MLKKMMALPFILLLTITLAQSCDTTEPPKNESQLSLSQIEVSSTEVWLQLKTDNLAIPSDINLVQNSELRKRITLTKQDTVLYVDSLLPNQTYIFQSIIQPTNQSSFESNKLQVTTMDTTSHDFTWQTFTFGAHSSSSLYDVTIINENDIWAVGQIYMNDSLGQPDLNLYNVVHWDGSK